ncbi:hypothetical protein HYFRA_00012512 [Hymenoscyphus fraxineus]|uniref:FAD-binding FR-type domain-containing protein n=1 Tax=Hymenoscyphus fraxineus TaxID=746836 RepID=A0A9N9L1R5_9HELO|nr:hypothetical protein HYFRA_00012512 [Hymenoscyphus fraxineus]
MAATATTPINETDPAATIAPFATLLNGVSQPMNMLFKDISWWTFGIFGLTLLTIRLGQRALAHMRHMSAMNLPGDAQRYWAINEYSWWWKFKKHMLYAPLKNKRHNRNIQLSKFGNMGTIPSRFHTLLITIFTGGNIAFCAYLSYDRPNHYSVVAELRGRTGVMAVVNMVALTIFAGRNNPLIGLLQISFDTYNLMHRWIGRIIVVEIIVHTACWAYVKHAATGWGGMWDMIKHDPFILWGSIGTVAMVLLAIQAFSPIRHAFYETFLNIHIILAAVAMAGTWIHCEVAHLPQVPWIQAIVVLWAVERAYRFVNLIYTNWAPQEGFTRATVESMPGEACRVTMHLPKKVNIKPGTHAYLRFSGIGPWESHPFSVAWIHHKPKNTTTLPITEKPEAESESEKALREPEMVTDVSFVIHAQSGMTRQLYNAAEKHGDSGMVIKAAFEGPYGGHHSLDSYGHTVLFAGASGITHQIPYVKHLITGFNNGTIATRRVTLIWIIRESDHLEWVRPWMDQILKLPRRREILQVKLFVTRPKNPRELQSPSSTVQMFPGRPNVKLLLENEVQEQRGAMCVTVCGPGGLADNVREAVREVQDLGVVDFIEESFTW